MVSRASASASASACVETTTTTAAHESKDTKNTLCKPEMVTTLHMSVASDLSPDTRLVGRQLMDPVPKDSTSIGVVRFETDGLRDGYSSYPDVQWMA